MTVKQLVQIRPGDRVLDYSFWRPTAQDIIDLNLKCVVRYISYGTSGKRVSLDEIRFLHSNGVAVLIVFEWSATRANLGRQAGLDDGRFSNGILKTLGYPIDPELACVFAIDTNTISGNILAHAAYSGGFDEGLGEYTASGIYGDNDIIAYCILHNITILNWWAGARSWSNYQPPIPGCHVQQLISGSTTNYDNNKVLIPFKAWLPHEERDEDMEVLTNRDTYKGLAPLVWKFIYNGIEKRQMTDDYGELFDAGKPLVRPEIAVSNACLDAIPDYSHPVGPTIPTRINGTLDLSAETFQGDLS